MAIANLLRPTPPETRRMTRPMTEEEEDEYYPYCDGKPMAETDEHADQMTYCKEALRAHFAGQKVYVSGNNFLYWEEGNRRDAISPDCYVVFDVEMRQRKSYRAWREGGRLPAVVIEITSRKTRKKNTETKYPLYEQTLKVPEYFLFDPTGGYLKPRLQGFKLVNGVYVPIPLVNNRLHSEALGLYLVWEGNEMRFFDPVKQIYLLSYEDQAQQLRDEADVRKFVEMQLRAEVEEKTSLLEAKTLAEAENERLRAELEAFRRQLGQQG